MEYQIPNIENQKYRSIIFLIFIFVSLQLAFFIDKNTAFAEGLKNLNDDCRGCHQIEVESFDLTLHSAEIDCAACHGDVKKHLSESDKKGNIINPANYALKKANAVCLLCHTEKERDVRDKFRAVANLHDDIACFRCHVVHLTAVDAPVSDIDGFRDDLSIDCAFCHDDQGRIFSESEHASSGLICSDCHLLHKISTISQDIEEQIEKCLSCHPQQQLEFKYPYPHPLRERQIKCSDCHNPHGWQFDKMLKKDGDRVCADCHADVAIEGGRHPAGKNADHPFGTVACMDCHRPHGSIFDKILIHNIDSICQTCHN
ncbi:MAG: hypothetical protein COV72_02570 [Candidatus Omnitrophica bacterium CG11_big_fil_rev_8_21_14_0_20_42_13]|uniref:Uncharacterized protein n=1 Tax=Candidatus Ghiorseimicrobium undicola TaxID=1974746 RepID=A0A2H0LYR5_9BACT|nr:MAG: hypothetical protein COV72_02570 [Candidatus Omnitrophica bacterium CG11_big_fil_rev_8_21_14_0_20_42_13]